MLFNLYYKLCCLFYGIVKADMYFFR